MDRRRVTQVVKARLAARTTFAMQTGKYPDSLKCVFERGDVDSLRIPPYKERSISFLGVGTGIPPTGVVGEGLNCLGSDWYEPALEELRIANGKDGVGQIDIGDRQAERFRRTQRGAIHQEKKRPHHNGIKAATASLVRSCGIQKALQFNLRIDVRLECRRTSRNDEWQRRCRDKPSADSISIESE